MDTLSDYSPMTGREAAEELRNPRRRRTLEEIYRLHRDGVRTTTYRLGKRLDVATATAKSRADPLVELGLVEENWEEVSERGADTRVYEITEEGEEALLAAIHRRLEELEEERKRLEELKERLGE